MPNRTDFAPGEFCWIDLNSLDLAAAAAWYGELFEWTHMLMPASPGAPPYAFFQRGKDVVAGIGQMSDEMKTQGIPPLWNSYVCSTDCQATEARVKALGGTVTVPTMEVPGHGKLAYFLDPEGASFAAWQPLGEQMGFLMQEPGSLSWNELMTRKPKQAQTFYGELFGWSFAPMPMEGIDYTILKHGDKDAGGMMPMDGPQYEGVPAHWLVYFAVADCDATAAKAKATGGTVMVPPTKIPVGKFSVLSDPQGAVFCVIELDNA